MSSFDITNKVDLQLMDNAINVARKEIVNRFDFRNSKTEIDFNKKDKIIHILTEDDMRLKSVIDVIRMRMVKQKLDPLILDEGKEHYASGNMVKKDLKLKEGIDADAARKIMKEIKDSKLKVSAQKMDDIIRVSAKKLDDLQRVIGLCERGDFGIPLQYVNMK
ncbi:MAG: YajQ family cyclic di-GMP-binding protein [Bacteroidia bacterium]|nr:YajQ family cyclic di-GMP-binding protein [Bacteroidia bacterium]